jgi:hypothetical protein
MLLSYAAWYARGAGTSRSCPACETRPPAVAALADFATDRFDNVVDPVDNEQFVVTVL